MEHDDVRLILVPGGGGSGPEHWHHWWAAGDPRCEWVVQRDPNDGQRDEWIDTIDRQINRSERPAVLVAHSLATIACAHWAAERSGPVVAALLVAPADVDIDADWAPSGSIYRRFRPIPVQALPFASTIVASTDDPYITVDRALELGAAWGSLVEVAGAHQHLGSDALLEDWPVGKRLLSELLARV